MRIAFVSADGGVPVFGCKGCSVHVQAVIRELRRAGHEVELFAMRLGGAPPADLGRIPVHRLDPAPGRGREAEHPLGINRRLRRALDRAAPFDLVYERYSLWSHAAMDWAAAQGVPGVLEVNAPLIEEQRRHRALRDPDAAVTAARRVFTRAATIVAVSDEVARYLAGFPGAAGKVRVIPNGVDPERFPPGVPPAIPRAPDRFTVGFLGSLKPWHGLEVLLEAFGFLHQFHPACRLLLVGDGPERAALEAEVRRRGLVEEVQFTGAVPPDTVPRWLAAMDCGVAPYRDAPDFYFSPLKVLEYMAAGLAVAASEVGQLRRIVRHGATGLLLPPGDPWALAGALARLRADPVLRARLARAGREEALREHTWRRAVERTFEAVAVPAAPAATGAAQ
jgi:glycosyltransferase involved in cell wall biosynthesis